MILDIENGLIDTVITKDLSRLGRDSSESTYYIKKFFPVKKIRYITVSDNVDTKEGVDMKALFLDLFNEFYADDISRKTKAAKETRAKLGKFMGSQVPYGYDKHSEDKNQLIIDEYSSNVFRRIFTEYAHRYSTVAISDKLNAEGILTPRCYYYDKRGEPNPYTSESGLWCDHTISDMLKREVYIGHMVQGKRKNIVYNKVRMCVDKKDWIRVENTHEIIVDELLWSKVQKMLAKNSKVALVGRSTKKDGKVSLIKSRLVCADCRCQMNYTSTKGVNKVYHKYRCSRNDGKGSCSYNGIQEPDLAKVVLEDINRITRDLIQDEQALLQAILALSDTEHTRRTKVVTKRVQALENEIVALKRNVASLTAEKFSSNISEDMFKVGLVSLNHSSAARCKSMKSNKMYWQS